MQGEGEAAQQPAGAGQEEQSAGVRRDARNSRSRQGSSIRPGQLVWVLSPGLLPWPALLTQPFDSSKHLWTLRQRKAAVANELALTNRSPGCK
jgi:hypothetical protein